MPQTAFAHLILTLDLLPHSLGNVLGKEKLGLKMTPFAITISPMELAESCGNCWATTHAAKIKKD
jgi:hypothetical protein